MYYAPFFFAHWKPAHVKQHPVWYAEEKMTPCLVALIKSMSNPPDMIVRLILSNLLEVADDEVCSSEN